ncbi:MAG: DNA topoisomerase III [Clostridiales bacterium]|jgi:DNA topoisomerase-3|nr:DNA topoisomerase III [Clostridiales bacterium]
MKTLVIAEKPSVGRDIARVLGCASKAEGCLFSEKYIVSWAIGHLVTLAEPEDYSPVWKRWSMDTLPIMPESIKLKPAPNTKKQLAVLKKLMDSKEAGQIICATDSGREGELIFRYIYRINGCTKPVKRLWISSMTDAAISAGLASMKDGKAYDALYESARCRSEADWLVGMNASRAFTIKYNALLSVGRVQTPTLAIIAARQKEIEAFVPKDYWEVRADFEEPTYTGVWFDPQTKDSKILDKTKAEEISAKVKGKEGVVSGVTTERKKVPPPQLYDLTELQRDANKRFGFSAQKTLSIAQDLYEKRKMITYPRTDSRHLSDDLTPKLPGLLKRLNIEPYKQYVSYALGLPSLPVTPRIVDNAKVSDHHAIIPADVTPRIASLSDDELKIYDLIVRRFIAVFYPAYIYDITAIISLVEGERFLTKGNTIVQPGWMELYPQDLTAAKDKPEEAPLPNVKTGDPVKVKDTKCVKKKTQPPKPYNEASLLSAMEHAGRFIENEELAAALKESGLGTPATRAAIIERLIDVGYITRKAKSLIPTEKGMKLIEAVPPELKSPETTGKWEKGLGSIAKADMDPEKFMASIKRYVNFLISSAKAAEKTVEFPAEARKMKRGGKSAPAKLGTCPKCGTGDILENSKKFYCSRWKDGCAFGIWKNALERFSITLDADTAGRLTRGEEAEAKGTLNGQEKTFVICLGKDLVVKARVK